MSPQAPVTWSDLAIDLYDKLTGRGAEISYDFNDFQIAVPGSTTNGAASAHWQVNGLLKIRTRDLPKE